MPDKKTSAGKAAKEKPAKKKTVKETAPEIKVQESAAPVVETTKPAAEKAAPVTEKKAPAEKKASDEKKAPAEKKAPVEKKTTAEKKALVEKKAPAEKKALVEKKAPAAKKAPAEKKAEKAAPAVEAKPEEKKKAPEKKKTVKKAEKVTEADVKAALSAVVSEVAAAAETAAKEAEAGKAAVKAAYKETAAAVKAAYEETAAAVEAAVKKAAKEAAAEEAEAKAAYKEAAAAVEAAYKEAAKEAVAEEAESKAAYKEAAAAVEAAVKKAAKEAAAEEAEAKAAYKEAAAAVKAAYKEAEAEGAKAAAAAEAELEAAVTEAYEAAEKEAAGEEIISKAAAGETSAAETAYEAAVADTLVETAKVIAAVAAAAEEPVKEEVMEEEPVIELPQPRRSVAFIGSECYPFIKTGGLGDVMYALPRALTKQNCDVKVILPRYACIPQKYQEKMVYRGEFQMDLCSDGRSFYVGIMEYVCDGVVYDFIDNNDFFSWGNPYTDLVRDIPKYCYFAKAALAALNYMDWIPDIIHCHDWQAALVPVYLRTLFADSPVGRAKSVITIHNLRFQGIYNIPTLSYWTGLPGYVFDYGHLKQGYEDANMLKGGLAYADMITTVSNTYAWEIQTGFYGEGLDAHLRFHSGKLRGIVNGIDVELWNSATDKLLAETYDVKNAVEKKKANKLALQAALGLEQNEQKMVIGLISRLTDQKGLDLVNAVFQQLIDGNTQVVVLGTGERRYEDAFRYYENANRGTVCSYISYNENLAHQIYAGADALLVPSLFEPCGLTQLIAMRYGTTPIVRETGGLKDTVQPYNQYTNEGNGFTFDRYEAGLLLDAINRAKTLYFTERDRWDEMVVRNMEKDVSWENSARQYRELYLQLRP